MGDDRELASPGRNESRYSEESEGMNYNSSKLLFLFDEDHLELPPSRIRLGEKSMDMISLRVGDILSGEERTIEGMARKLCRSIRDRQSRGPYYLAAMPSAVLLVYEAAVQLVGDDQQVAFIGWGINAPRTGGQEFGATYLSRPSVVAEYTFQPVPVPIHVFTAEAVLPPGITALLGSISNENEVQMRFECVDRIQCRPKDQRGVLICSLLEKAESIATTDVIARSNSRGSEIGGFDPTVALRVSDREGINLFCVPGAGASVTSFADFISHLSPSLTVWGLEPRGLGGLYPPHSTVQAAAQFNLDQILRLGKHTIFHLVGHSFGGWVVLDMASQLQRSGRTVPSITILDSDAPGEVPSNSEHSRTDVMFKYIEALELIMERPLRIDRAEIENRPDILQRRYLHQRLVSEGALPRRSSADLLKGTLRALAAGLRAEYTPDTPYHGSVQLILVDDPKLSRDGNRLEQSLAVEKWKKWAPDLVYCHAPGNHMTLLRDPHVKFVASRVNALL